MTSLIFHCLLAACLMVNGMDVYELAKAGGELSASEAEALEKKVTDNPRDIDTRTMLLGYYFSARTADRAKHKSAHVLWLIKNSPEAEVLGSPYGGLDHILNRKNFAKAKALWLKQLEQQPENLVILKNASDFFTTGDPDKTEELLLRGQTLDPKNPAWPMSLGHHYSRSMIIMRSKLRIETASIALSQFELAYELSEHPDRDALLTELGKLAFAAEEMEKAKSYAKLMIESDSQDWNYGNKIHHGNNILGRVALAAGDVEEAKKRLIKAARTPGSPQLDSFGPNMQLANELLQAGEKEVVLECFDLCENFWEMGADRLEGWRKSVRAGTQPNFRANLLY